MIEKEKIIASGTKQFHISGNSAVLKVSFLKARGQLEPSPDHNNKPYFNGEGGGG